MLLIIGIRQKNLVLCTFFNKLCIFLATSIRLNNVFDYISNIYTFFTLSKSNYKIQVKNQRELLMNYFMSFRISEIFVRFVKKSV